jgi:hypothetical protein
MTVPQIALPALTDRPRPRARDTVQKSDCSARNRRERRDAEPPPSSGRSYIPGERRCLCPGQGFRAHRDPKEGRVHYDQHRSREKSYHTISFTSSHQLTTTPNNLHHASKSSLPPSSAFSSPIAVTSPARPGACLIAPCHATGDTGTVAADEGRQDDRNMLAPRFRL